MLAKKYSDTGGLMAEDDAKELTKMYVRYGELSQESEKIQIKNNQSEKEKENRRDCGEISVLKKILSMLKLHILIYLIILQMLEQKIELFNGTGCI